MRSLHSQFAWNVHNNPWSVCCAWCCWWVPWVIRPLNTSTSAGWKWEWAFGSRFFSFRFHRICRCDSPFRFGWQWGKIDSLHAAGDDGQSQVRKLKTLSPSASMTKLAVSSDLWSGEERPWKLYYGDAPSVVSIDKYRTKIEISTSTLWCYITPKRLLQVRIE